MNQLQEDERSAEEAIGKAATGEDWERFSKNLGFMFNADPTWRLVKASTAADAEPDEPAPGRDYRSVPAASA